MKIKWLGHSAFLLTAQEGTRVITDPYKPGSFSGAVGYKPIREEADIVIISHEHDDHNYPKEIGGQPTIVKDVGEKTVKNIKIKGIPTWHDTSQGKERGMNTVFVFEIDGLKIGHLGDLGHTFDEEEVKKIRTLDILLIPVGGYFTIDASQATKIVESLAPKLVIPMHFKTPVLGFPVAQVDDFLKGKTNVKRLDSSEVEVTKEKLPKVCEIWVLKPELG